MKADRLPFFVQPPPLVLSALFALALGTGSSSAQSLWKPTPAQNLSWQWQISSVPAPGALLDVDMYDVDLFNTPAATLAAMKAKGIKTVCYFSAGTYEGWRADWKQFFPFITGEEYAGSEKPFLGNMAEWDERWLDVREIDLLKPIMTARLKLAKEKGCDAVEPDNMDSYANLGEVKPAGAYTAAHQLAYNRAIAKWAHEQGLSVGLKNDVDQIDELVEDFDWALNEQCYQYSECAGYKTFVDAGKAVFGVEYSGDTSSFCPKARAAHMSWLKKNLDLGAFRQACNEGRAAVAIRGDRKGRKPGNGEQDANRKQGTAARAAGDWRDGLGRSLRDDVGEAPAMRPGVDPGAHSPRYFFPKEVGEK